MSEALCVTAAGKRLEAAWFGAREGRARAIVLLHEGLGCVAMWKEFPELVAERTKRAVFAYSRAGYGTSDAVSVPRPLEYMRDEGLVVLGEVLDGAKIEEALLVGHSDGGSIAIVHAGGADPRGRVRGLVTLAAHVFCEELSVASIAKAKDAFEHGDLRERLVRYHGDNVDGAFWGWNRAWLDPAFMQWDITEYLPRIGVDTVVIQGQEDPYGTKAQVDAITRGVRGAVSTVMLPGCGHAPHKERPEETLDAIATLSNRVFSER